MDQSGRAELRVVRLNVAPAETHGVASFYGMFSLSPRPPVTAHVCDDIACIDSRASALCGNWRGNLGRRVRRAPVDK